MTENAISKREPKISLVNLQDAAVRKKWEIVDQAIPAICNDLPFVHWASQAGIRDANDDLRDLAASILEKSNRELKPDEVDRLRTLMKTDKNPYVRFRSAFALFTHGARSPQVIQELYSALKDPAVGKIADGYLRQLK